MPSVVIYYGRRLSPKNSVTPLRLHSMSSFEAFASSRFCLEKYAQSTCLIGKEPSPSVEIDGKITEPEALNGLDLLLLI